LEAERDGGEVLRETLRTHLGTGGNISSSAAALGVDRRTVTRRIRTIEEKLGHSLPDRAAEVEVALRLWELEGPSPAPSGTRWDTDPRDHPQSGQAPPPPG
jgi:DNA-binding PucR family transcriptional regulator